MFDGKHRIGRSISRSSGKVRARISEEPANVLIAHRGMWRDPNRGFGLSEIYHI